MNYTVLAVGLIVMIAVYTFGIVYVMSKNPIWCIFMYPKSLQAAYYKQQHYIPSLSQSKTVLLKKAVLLAFVIAIMTILIALAEASTKEAIIAAYVIWFILVWWDFAVVDCIFFARKKELRLPGTEEMDEEYASKWFHFVRAIKGTVLGAFVALAVGACVHFLAVV